MTKRLHELHAWLADLSSAALDAAVHGDEAFASRLSALLNVYEPGLRWELDENALFISPAHNKSLVDAAAKLVQHFDRHPLPHLDVQLFKPRRGWEGEFAMQIDGRSVSIDTRSWRYHLFVYDDGEVELELVIPDEQRDLLATAAPTVFLDSEVGEGLAMKLLAITVVCASDVDGSTIPIKHLHEQLDELLSQTLSA